jgi:hypothetical protein
MRRYTVFRSDRTKMFQVKRFCPIGGSFVTKGGMGGAGQAVWIASLQYDACRISLVLIWACFTGLLVALSASPWPFDKADDHAA